MSLDALINKALCEYNMLNGKNKIIVALSGGADSICLVHYLKTHETQLGITVCAAHLNHCIRGEEAQRDYLFVKSFCEKYGIELYYTKKEIPKLARQRKIGEEQCGREERYKFFDSLVTDVHTAVATAHTSSDNAETVLFNIIRGCGVDGLCGIPPVRGSIIRPLIFCSRKMIEEYCSDNNLSFVTDSTNLKIDYTRNKIRLNVLPLLKEINPEADEAVNRLSLLAEKETRHLKKECRKVLNGCKTDKGLDIAVLKSCDDYLLSAVLKTAVQEYFDITPEKKHIDLIVNEVRAGSGAAELRKDRIVRCRNGILVFDNRINNESYDSNKAFEISNIQLGSTYRYKEKYYTFSEKKIDFTIYERKVYKKLLNDRISCDIIAGDVLFRNRRSGDYFKPFGRNCTKSVKKLFTELKIPSERRNDILMLAQGSEVLWIEGIGISEKAAVRSINDMFFTIEAGEEKNA